MEGKGIVIPFALHLFLVHPIFGVIVFIIGSGKYIF